jgi:hypothetical protein
MNDDDRHIERLERRLRQLPQEVTPGSELWQSIEQSILDEPLDAKLARLDNEIEPGKDLWPSIAEAIRHDRNLKSAAWSRKQELGFLLAACVALVAIGGFFLRGAFVPGDGPLTVPETNQTAGQANGSDSVFANQQFVDDLLFPVSAAGETGDAQAIYRDHIALVRDQRKSIEESIQLYPNDPSLRTLWQHTYETELSLIDEAGRALTTI